MIWAAFFLGLFVGGFIGLGAMCLCVISGDESRREELRDAKVDTEQDHYIGYSERSLLKSFPSPWGRKDI